MEMGCYCCVPVNSMPSHSPTMPIVFGHDLMASLTPSTPFYCTCHPITIRCNKQIRWCSAGAQFLRLTRFLCKRPELELTQLGWTAGLVVIISIGDAESREHRVHKSASVCGVVRHTEHKRRGPPGLVSRPDGWAHLGRRAGDRRWHWRESRVLSERH